MRKLFAECNVYSHEECENCFARLYWQERFTRLKTLGADYTEEAIKKRIAGTRSRTGKKLTQENGISLLIDIENNIKLYIKKVYIMGCHRDSGRSGHKFMAVASVFFCPLCYAVKPHFQGYRYKPLATSWNASKKQGYARHLRPLFRNKASLFSHSFCRLLSCDFLSAIGAIFRIVGLWRKRHSAYGAAAFFLRCVKLCKKFSVKRKHRIWKPFAKKRTGNKLRTKAGFPIIK